MANQKTILLTGATGFLGSELLKRFIMLDYDIKILVRANGNINPEEKIMRLLAKARLGAAVSQFGKVQVFEGDVTENNLGLSEKIFHELSNSVHEVFHCAAATKFSGLNREDLLNTNYTGTKNIIKFCLSGREKHLHYISTAYVAGEKRGIVYENELNDFHGFHNHYEESKFFAEKAVHKYASTHKLHYTIYRPSIIVGDSITSYTMNFDGIYLFSRTLFLLKRRLESKAEKSGSSMDQSLKEIGVTKLNSNVHIPVRIPANPTATINLVPIDYVTNAIISIFLDKNRLNKTFHITNSYPPKLKFLLESISDTIGITGTVIVGHDEFHTKAMTSLEKKAWEKIKVYGLYMHNEPYFQSSNTQLILNDFCIECPKITREFISNLIKYAIASNWGNNKLSQRQLLFTTKTQRAQRINKINKISL
ncbi:MAG: SDR family oxidoreductase [Candidatus Anammoxibacter sp.]